MDKAAQYLGLARKGGMLAVGEEGSGTAIAARKGAAFDARRRRFPQRAETRRGFSVRSPRTAADAALDEAELSAMLGKRGCSMLCFTDLPLAARFAAALTEELPGWKETAELLAQREDKRKRRKAAPP